ncbi:MAG: WYL domain-containing protein [Brachybacterium sp.]|uniref:WYL domain-containing protein n=1 Tax=Brachybacterium sp. TaxID=1891286 RepID=UPI002647B7B1|nr:WYL domain-containing protein [Brachybacterium sp.]MDN5685157.1 WYL domain-containing protein [Brachybacterium sp.]
MVAAKGVERLLNVIMTIGSRRRIDRAKLFAVIPDYASATSDQAAERMFERDKAAILELGLPLATERDVLDENTVYYRIDAGASDAVLDLTTEEYTVLLAASRAWDDAAAGGAARRVRSKLLSLGHDADPDLLRRTPRGAVESLPVLSPLLEAVTAARSVRFTYRGTQGVPAQRHVEPWVVGVHEGHWYIHGWDLDRSAPRLFRASRIESFPTAGPPAVQERPEQTDLASVLEAMHESDDQARAVVAAAPFKALALRDRAGAPLDAERLELSPLPRPAARRLVLADVRWGELLEPATWRAELAEVLTAIADAHEGEGDLAGVEAAAVRPEPRIRTTPTGADTLSRLISEASYVMERGEVDLAELSAALGVSTTQLITDLQVLFVCGDMGTGWEDLIEAEWEHGTVRVRNAEPLRRALRLSAVEITALLAGLAALEPSAGEAEAIVASARRKLLAEAASVDEMASRTADRAESVLTAVHRALRADADGDASRLTIRYSSTDRPGTSVRRIRPLRIDTDGTRSYLLADCELAEAERRFRLDRIVEILPPGTPQVRAGTGAGPTLDGLVDGQVWLRLDPPGRWVAESFDADQLRDGTDGSTFARVDSPVRAALVDAVLESAGAVEVLSPRELRDTIVTVARVAGTRHTQA